MYRIFTASRLGWGGTVRDILGDRVTGNRDKQGILGRKGTSWQTATIQVKDIDLKDAVEERRAKDQEILANS